MCRAQNCDAISSTDIEHVSLDDANNHNRRLLPDEVGDVDAMAAVTELAETEGMQIVRNSMRSMTGLTMVNVYDAANEATPTIFQYTVSAGEAAGQSVIRMVEAGGPIHQAVHRAANMYASAATRAWMTASPTVAASPITDQNAGLDIPNLLQRNMLASIAGTATGSVVDHAWSTADYIMRSILGHLNAGGAEDDWVQDAAIAVPVPNTSSSPYVIASASVDGIGGESFIMDIAHQIVSIDRDWTRIPRTFREHTNTITEADQALYAMLELSDSGAIIHPSIAHHVTMYRSQLLRKSYFRMIA